MRAAFTRENGKHRFQRPFYLVERIGHRRGELGELKQLGRHLLLAGQIIQSTSIESNSYHLVEPKQSQRKPHSELNYIPYVRAVLRDLHFYRRGNTVTPPWTHGILLDMSVFGGSRARCKSTASRTRRTQARSHGRRGVQLARCCACRTGL